MTLSGLMSAAADIVGTRSDQKSMIRNKHVSGLIVDNILFPSGRCMAECVYSFLSEAIGIDLF